MAWHAQVQVRGLASLLHLTGQPWGVAGALAAMLSLYAHSEGQAGIQGCANRDAGPMPVVLVCSPASHKL